MNAIVVQCGGPTPVINASLAAIVRTWQKAGSGRIYGARYGMEGLTRDDWVDLQALDASALDLLATQPAAALGGSRHRPPDAEMATLPARLAAHGIGVAFLIGGGGTMTAAHSLHAAAQAQSIPLQVLGVPKTIDNDLAGCDATPGYGSAARYIAHTVQEIGLDLRAMRGFDQVAVVEIMGRHAGWLTATAALARTKGGDPPHLILLPEAPVTTHAVLDRIATGFGQRRMCAIALAEGVREAGGDYWADLAGGGSYDGSGQRVFSMSAGASAYLVQQVQERLGLRCRQIKLNTAQRSTRLLASPVDRRLAALAGSAAVAAWAQGSTDVMPALRLEGGEWGTTCLALGEVVGRERTLPPEYIDAAGYDVTEECRQYIAPLLGELPPTPLLWIE